MPTFIDFLGAKTGAGANTAGPTDAVQWISRNRGPYSRGDKNEALLVKMFDKFYELVSMPKGSCVQLTGGVGVFAGAGPLAAAISNATAATPAANTYNLGQLKKATKMMTAVALNMESWAYPACRYYHTATPSEAEAYLSNDFVAKHVSSTEDEKGTKKTAVVRSTPTATRTVHAYGGIVTSRSGGLKKDAVDAFKKEIKERQQEFIDTHVNLSNFFADNFLYLKPGGTTGFVYIDSITFISKNTYGMYEYDANSPGSARPTEGDFYIHFSLSCTADGSKWVVHHLATTASNRTVPGGTKVAATGLVGDGGADAATYLADPWE